ncbi:MAG: metallophosphoesterase family protein [Bacillota bacterium]|jgi:exonuclease SbcD
MRLLHTADLHLGKLLEGRQRYDEQQQVLDEITDIAEKEDTDLVLISGDIFDTYNPSAQAQELFFVFLHKISAKGLRPVIVSAGNHDQPQRLSAAGPLALTQNIYLIGQPGEDLSDHIIQENPYFISYQDNCLRIRLPKTGEEVAVLALPYISEARLNEIFLHDISDDQAQKSDYQQRLQQLLEKGSRQFSHINIIMAHLSLCGGQTSQSERPLGISLVNDDENAEAVMIGGSFGISPQIFPCQAQYIALGHLHRPQSVGQQPTCYYAGSPLAYSFSEAGQSKSVVIADLEAGQPAQVKRVALTSGYALHKFEAQNYDEALAWCSDENNHQLWVSLAIKTDKPLSMDDISRLRKAHPRILDILPIFPQLCQEQKPFKLEDLSIEEKFRIFAAIKEGVEPEPELIAMFMDLLSDEEEQI